MLKNYARVTDQILSTWTALIEPVATYEPAKRQNLQLLAALCLIASVVSIAIAVFSMVFVSGRFLADPLLYVLVPLMLVTFSSYLLTRWGYARVAVTLLSVFITGALYIAAVGANRPTPFFYLIVSIFLLSLVFSRTALAFITLLQVGGLFVFVVVGRQFSFTQIFLGPGLYLIMTTVFLILFWRYIESREALRREAVTRSETYLRSIIDNIPDHIYIKDLNHRFLMVNQSLLRKYKLQHESEILGKTDNDTMGHHTTLDINELIEEEQAVFSTGTPLVNKECFDPVNFAVPSWILVTKVPLRDSQGNVMGLIGINRNITDMKQAEAELREREQTLQRILDNMPVLFDAFDENDNIVAWNRECERVTGYLAEEMIGQPGALKRLYPNEQDLHRAIATSDHLNRNYRDLEWELTCKDGSHRTIAWSNISQEAPIPGWDSWCIGVDVTERKRVEAQTMKLALQNERLYLVGEFVRAVSHDFRTALSNIQNNGYFIRRATKNLDLTQVPERLNRIQDNINRLVQQIDNLQTMASLQHMDMAPMDINQILRVVVASQEDRLQERSIKVVFTLNDHIPLVMADSDNIQQALHNLIDNAINHSAEGGLLLFNTHYDAYYVYVDVIDRGAGIASDKLAYIFDLFYRTDEARTLNRGGVGLGLSIVKMIAEAHNGTIQVESTPNEGSTFTLTLPLKPS